MSVGPASGAGAVVWLTLVRHWVCGQEAHEAFRAPVETGSDMAKDDASRGELSERAQEALRATKRADRNRAVAMWSLVAVLAIVFGALVFKLVAGGGTPATTATSPSSSAGATSPSTSAAPSAPAATATAASAGTIAGVTTTTGLSAGHVLNIPEPTPTAGVRVPPVGGDHDPVPQNCGVYDTPVGTWHAVHSLEHGAVWITYAPGLAADQIALLAADAKGHDHVLVSPYPDQPSPVILTAWGLQLRVDSASDPRVQDFIAMYENGPQTPELGAPCSGGVGQPLG